MNTLSPLQFHTIVFDFDGIFTDNKVWTSENGIEWISCDRRDGLGLSMLKKYATINSWNVSIFILSKEKNKCVAKRAQKLNICCHQGIDNKLEFLKGYLSQNSLDSGGLIYLGNDLNDLEAIKLASLSYVPADSHSLIKEYASIVLETNGGNGFIREFVEHFLDFQSFSDQELNSLLQ